MIGKRVLVRTRSAGVHFGELVSKNGMEVHLKNGYRLWSWNGALSLSSVATKGVTLGSSKIDGPVEEINLPESIEIILIGEKSNLPC